MMDLETYRATRPEAFAATHHGQPADRGKVIIGRQFPGEGFATLACGNTEIQISYSILHNLRVQIDRESPVWGDLAALQQAIHSITCEASIGRTGRSSVQDGAAPMPEWTGIASAPTDGSPIWLGRHGAMRIGFWAAGEANERHGTIGGGWIDAAAAEGSGARGLRFAPTVWMRLPTPPSG